MSGGKVSYILRFVFKKQALNLEKKCQNWTKNDQVMPNIMFLCQSGIWPILCQLMAILAKLLDMDFKFVLLGIYINFNTQTNFEVNQNQKSNSMDPKTLQKITKMAISQNPILPKCHSPKSLLLLHFLMNLSEKLRIKNRPRLVCAKSIFTLILNVSDKFIEKCRSRLFGE